MQRVKLSLGSLFLSQPIVRLVLFFRCSPSARLSATSGGDIGTKVKRCRGQQSRLRWQVLLKQRKVAAVAASLGLGNCWRPRVAFNPFSSCRVASSCTGDDVLRPRFPVCQLRLSCQQIDDRSPCSVTLSLPFCSAYDCLQGRHGHAGLGVDFPLRRRLEHTALCSLRRRLPHAFHASLALFELRYSRASLCLHFRFIVQRNNLAPESFSPPVIYRCRLLHGGAVLLSVVTSPDPAEEVWPARETLFSAAGGARCRMEGVTLVFFLFLFFFGFAVRDRSVRRSSCFAQESPRAMPRAAYRLG